MDTLKSAMDDAATECSLNVPSLFATNTTASYAQLKRYMYSTAKELLSRHDWAVLTLDQTITGDGGDTYDLAADFGRLTRRDEVDEPAVWSDGMQRVYRPVTSNGGWTVLTSMGAAGTYGYRVVGTQIQFTQNIAASETVTVSYVSNAWISSAGSKVATWADDADFTYLPARLIELGTTWRWRRKRGLEFASYQGEFEMEFSRFANDDRSIRKISFGQRMAVNSPYANLPVPELGPDPNI